MSLSPNKVYIFMGSLESMVSNIFCYIIFEKSALNYMSILETAHFSKSISIGCRCSDFCFKDIV